MAKTITISGTKSARVNVSIDPLTGDMALMASFSLTDASGTVIQSKTVDATAKLTAAQRTAAANIAASVFGKVLVDEGV